ncbi:hypothetical protein SUGI_0838450 [Cryptomeria japonica]|nr:hypothetical protein SUGI_0838450 [Cryptomeria japonica]
MEGLGNKLVVGAPTHIPLQHQQWRRRHCTQAHTSCSPVTLLTIRSSLHPIHKAVPGHGQGQQPIRPIASIRTNAFSANIPQKNIALISTNSFAESNPRKPTASIETNSSVESNPQKPIASIETNSSDDSNPQKSPVPTQFFFCSASNQQAGNHNTVNSNLNPIEKLRKVARAGLLVATISFLSLNAQGMLFCRPARAAWYWPFGKTTEESTTYKTFKTTEEFWKNEKVPWDFKERVLEMIVNARPKDGEALKGLLALRMRDGEFDSAIEIVDTLMYKQPYEMEWRLVKAQIQDSAGRLDEAKEGFQFYLTVDEFNPRALQGLAMVMHKQGEDAAMGEMLEERLQRALNKQLDKEAYNVKLLLAHAYILQDNLEEALKQYQHLVDEKPRDFRPYLCQGILYSVLAKTEGRKRYEERKKEEELLAQGKMPMRPMKEPNIVEAIQDMSENESNIGEEIQNVPKSASNQVEDSEDLPVSEFNRDGDSESNMDGDSEVLPESERSEVKDIQDLTEAERKG